MQITSDNFKKLYQKQLGAAKLFMIERARGLVLQQYCNKLTVRGACTGDCATCGIEIAKALHWMVENNIPRMSYGVFGKLMKTAFANRLEELTKRAPVKLETNSLGEATERDALDILMETFNG